MPYQETLSQAGHDAYHMTRVAPTALLFTKECGRVIRRGGKMVFPVISIAPDLSPADHLRAVEAGPPYVEAECEYAELLEATGWQIIEQFDVSPPYEETGRRHIREVEARADEMTELLGETELADMLVRRNKNVKAVVEGIVRRDLFVASPLPSLTEVND